MGQLGLLFCVGYKVFVYVIGEFCFVGKDWHS